MNYLIKHGFQLISDGADWKQRSTTVSIQIIETIISTSNGQNFMLQKIIFLSNQQKNINDFRICSTLKGGGGRGRVPITPFRSL